MLGACVGVYPAVAAVVVAEQVAAYGSLGFQIVDDAQPEVVVMCRRLPGVGAPIPDGVVVRRAHRPAAYLACLEGEPGVASILACRLSGPAIHQGWWTLPGGGVDPGEALEVAARRELAEETGLWGEAHDMLASTSTDIRWIADDGVAEVLTYEQTVFEGAVAGGSLTHETDGSTNRAAWLRIDQLHELALTHVAVRGLQAVIRRHRRPTPMEVVQAHLAAVVTRDVQLMTADYSDHAVLTRGDDRCVGAGEISAYFASVPQRLAHGWVAFERPEPAGAGSLGVAWRIVGGPGHAASGHDTFVVSDGWIVEQRVELTTADF